MQKLFTITINMRKLQDRVRRGPKGKGKPPVVFADRTKYNRKKQPREF